MRVCLEWNQRCDALILRLVTHACMPAGVVRRDVQRPCGRVAAPCGEESRAVSGAALLLQRAPLRSMAASARRRRGRQASLSCQHMRRAQRRQARRLARR